jgi:hypothetical protein
MSYAYCASGCDQLSNWGVVNVPAAQALAVDPQGHPRLLGMGADPGRDVVYSECNGNCTSSSSWTSVTVDPGPVNKVGGVVPRDNPTFAFDPSGHPAFMRAMNQGGTIEYWSCASDCTNSMNWKSTSIPTPTSSGIVTVTGLAVDTQGRARATYTVNDLPKPITHHFLESDADCSTPGNWKDVVLQIGVGVIVPRAVTLALDSQGRPRLLWPSSPPVYAWCDANCTDPSSWQHQDVPGAEAASLAIDAQDRPQLAYYDKMGGGVRYKRCVSGCNSSSANWEEKLLPDGDMDAVDPLPVTGMDCLPPMTTASWGWDTNNRVSLALDSAGEVAVAYSAAHVQFPCYPNNDLTNPTYETNARGVFLREWGEGNCGDAGSGAAGAGGVTGGAGGAGGSSSSGAGGSACDQDGGMAADASDTSAAEGGSVLFSNFVGSPWTGTETESLTCGGLRHAPVTGQVSWSFQPTASGFTFTDASGCSWALAVSGDTATLATTPETCSIPTDGGTQLLSVSSGTFKTPDGHHLTGGFVGTVSEGATVCSVDASIALAR